MAEMANRLDAGDNTPATPVVETETRAVPELTTGETDEKQESQDSSSTEGETDEGSHAVPYKRFKSVNEAKKELQSRNSALEKQLEGLRAQMDEKPTTPTQERDEFDDIFNMDDQESPTDERYSSLESRLRSFEEKQALTELETELESVTTQYPNVPESVLLQSVVNDPNSNMTEVAKMYDGWLSEVEERAIARYAATQKDAVRAPRRPAATGGTGPTKNPRPRTMEEARAGALSYWKEKHNLK